MTDTVDTSALFSLAELAKLEEERVGQESAARARAREEAARIERERDTRRKAETAAAAEREETARIEREREQTRERARLEARELARVEVARIEAEGKVRLAADDTARAHELARMRERSGAARSLRERRLACALGVLTLGGALAGYGAVKRADTAEATIASLREAQTELTGERNRARAAESAALARARESSPSRGAATDGASVLAALDGRLADLSAWAAKQGRTNLVAASRDARARAMGAGASDAERFAYQRALDALRDALSHPREARPAHGAGATKSGATTPARLCTHPQDPICADGKTL